MKKAPDCFLPILLIAALAGSVTAAPVTLKTVTTDDKTASVGIPDGWKLANGSNGFVHVTGPHDERINLGLLVVVKNGPATAGSPGGEVAFAMPFSASLKEKLTKILVTGATKQRLPTPTVTIASESPTKLPMCSRLLGTSTAGSDSTKFEGIICSMKPDWLGLYKNLVFLVQAPASQAEQARPILEAIAASYRVTPAMFQKMLATYTPLPPVSRGVAMPPGLAPYQNPGNSAECFDYNVIRESPPWEVPMRCGGIQPF